ncbi:MAG: hypothetical protein IJ454_01720 [Clostridia bacterium]|nr:hypothetical protein [Clostridia bacterium]
MLNYKKSIVKYLIPAVMLALICKSSQVMEAVHASLRLCFSTVIPSLFPFMVLSSAFVGNFSQDGFGIVGAFTERLLGMSGCAASVLICSLVCGYPIGAKCTVELYKSKKISASEAESLIAYLNNAGPLFVIGAVGIGMFGSLKAGLILYAVQTISALSAGILLKRHTERKIVSPISPKSSSKDFTACVCESVIKILHVSGFIVFFAVINALVMPILSHAPTAVKCLIASFLEITNGMSCIKDEFTALSQRLIIASAALGWSGLSVHMQVKSTLGDTKLSMKKYYIARIYMCIFSAILTYILVNFSDDMFLALCGNEVYLFIGLTAIFMFLAIGMYKKEKPATNRKYSMSVTGHNSEFNLKYKH